MINIAKEDITNKKFGKLTALYINDDKTKNDKYHRTYWHCICECGNEKDIPINALKSGNSKSCGCANRIAVSKAAKERHMKDRNKYNLDGNFGIGYTKYGEEFYFDLEDYDLIKDYNWFINDQKYVIANVWNGAKKYERMHRLIMGVSDISKDEIEVDHIHGINSRNDNRKTNLRLATHSQNGTNKGLLLRNTSGVTGVDFVKSQNKWRARVRYKKKEVNLGLFDNFEDAVKARKDAEEKYYGEYSYDNSMNIDINKKVAI